MRPVGIGLRVLRLFGVVLFAGVAGSILAASVFGPRQLTCLYQELQRGPARAGVPCLKLTNQQAQAYLLRNAADSFWRQDRVAEAMTAYRLGARVDPSIADYLYAAGTQAIAAGNLSTGIAYLTAYLDIPGVPTDKLYLARNLRRFGWEQQDRLNAALASFGESIGIAARSRGLVDPVSAEIKQKWLEDAMRELKTAIELDPNNDGAYWQRAGLRIDLGDVPGALEDSAAALRLSPDKWQNVSRRATVLVRAQKPAEALKLVDDFEARVGKGAPTERMRGEILAGGGQLKPAKEALDRAIALAKNDEYAYWLRGRINSQLGDLDAAIADARQSKALGFDGAQSWIDAYTARRDAARAR